MSLPATYTDINETQCCAVPDIDQWDQKVVDFQNQQFMRLRTRSFMYVPLNMAGVMTKLQQEAQRAHVSMPPNQVMTLSRDLSPWQAEHLYAVTAPVPGADNVILDGEFASKVFEGPYGDAKVWMDGIRKYARSLGRVAGDVYFFYTTCPKCAKHYGKNYVIALTKLVGSNLPTT
ncbi:MAG: hypothetical protein F2923_08705 [Actinobacteria bacterium]|uniref:Unannotated protein n=1 Tax=freshwater metagenome TaxID=449393 RepID=A0A6J7GE88_9ZZZZ|nr:hypothetical protein [Actinomycetota bacterium]MTB28702.1 hypothetical protein [Actinomycetota bacterium]